MVLSKLGLGRGSFFVQVGSQAHKITNFALILAHFSDVQALFNIQKIAAGIYSQVSSRSKFRVSGGSGTDKMHPSEWAGWVFLIPEPSLLPL